MDIFDLFEEVYQGGCLVSLCWYYDWCNEWVVELVEEFCEDCSFFFVIQVYDEQLMMSCECELDVWIDGLLVDLQFYGYLLYQVLVCLCQ